MNHNYKKIEDNFYYVKELINDKFMFKSLIDGFYFTDGSIEAIEKAQSNYFMNQYYNLKTSDVLNMIDDANSLTDVKKGLFYEYAAEFAAAWYDNFLTILERVKKA